MEEKTKSRTPEVLLSILFFSSILLFSNLVLGSDAISWEKIDAKLQENLGGYGLSNYGFGGMAVELRRNGKFVDEIGKVEFDRDRIEIYRFIWGAIGQVITDHESYPVIEETWLNENEVLWKVQIYPAVTGTAKLSIEPGNVDFNLSYEMDIKGQGLTKMRYENITKTGVALKKKHMKDFDIGWYKEGK